MSVFAALHHRREALLLPNAWDVASALVLQDAGHPAIGTTSLGITAAAGLADGAGAGRDLSLALATALAPRLRVPLTVDAEDGYDDAIAFCRELSELGVAGVNLEDRLRPVDEHAEMVASVVASIPSLFVNARTDTHWLGNGDLDDAIRRAVAYRDAGAHCVFIPGMTNPHEISAVITAIGIPLNVLTQPDGVVPPGVARISTGSSLYRRALSTLVERDLGYDELAALLGAGSDP